MPTRDPAGERYPDTKPSKRAKLHKKRAKRHAKNKVAKKSRKTNKQGGY
jgi:hypothetical protein